MGLQVSVYDEYGGRQIGRWGARSRALRLGSNRHGYSDLTDFIEMSLYDAFRFYTLAKTPWIVVRDQWHNLAWEGRLERPKIVPGGLEIAGFGGWQAFDDAPYTAFWSRTGTADWRQVTEDDLAGYTPGKWDFNLNNRLYLSPRTGETIRKVTGDFGGLTFAVPHLSETTMNRIECDYEIDMPADWRLRLIGVNEDFSGPVNAETITSAGTPDSGSIDENFFLGKSRVIMQVYNNSADDEIVTETGVIYAKLTNLRLGQSSISAITGDMIAENIVSFVNTLNPNQLRSSTALIEATTLELDDEIYEDAPPNEVLDYLANLSAYEAGVWRDQRLHFRPQGSAARQWVVAAEDIQLERVIESLYNSAYGVYSDANGRTLRTAVATDANSVSRWGLTRRAAVPVSSSSAATAEAARDKFINEHKEAAVRVALSIRRLRDRRGKDWPGYLARAGDIVTIANLPPSLGSTADLVRRFSLAETNYDAQSGILQPVADLTLPTLEALVASALTDRRNPINRQDMVQ